MRQLRSGLLSLGADLVMTYIEQPDGSGHQFLMIDPRQPSDFLDPTSIGANQDPAKRARYRNYLRTAYQVANEAVHRIIEAVGIAPDGRPNSDILVVSDDGFAPFHTAVNMTAFLASNGFDTTKVRAVTSGPAVNVYINLQGREPGGTVSRAEYLELQERLVEAMRQSKDTNPNYTGPGGTRLFDQVFPRPTPQDILDTDFGLSTNPFICKQELREVRNIDIAPTVLRILEVEPADTVQGRVINLCPPARGIGAIRRKVLGTVM